MSFENIYSAYLAARRGRRYKPEILRFGFQIENNLTRLKFELENQIYHHGDYREFIVNDSKKRLIKVAPFRDRVAHHAVCNILNPIFDRGFIYDSYACRVNKGARKAVLRLTSFLQEEFNSHKRNYCLQCDIAGFFKNINHQVLKKIISRKVRDTAVLFLLDEIIDSDRKNPLIGIPLGNLTSQLFANIYLNELDQFIKHHLRVKKYLRYMDDFLIIHNDKKKLHEFKNTIACYLRDVLCLNFHPKKANIAPVEKGIDFLGYLVFKDHRTLRKSTVKRFLKKIKQHKIKIVRGQACEDTLYKSLQSWNAYADFASSWRLRKKMNLFIN
ncbi:group II intron reverse transcriptase domain-containing protein [Candidatus Wolfebacteria bacterium]|nr:group II intron reverse transcriptase domain-containing protein [Candidatus Wolfebacteria bacterium]